MAELTLEQRVAALEQTVAELKQRLPKPFNWLEPREPLTPEQLEAHKAVEAYGRYFRKTGQQPPPDWKPGDPIPDPPEWSEEQ